ncbi:MAG: hypothetical protein ACQESR_11370 [Planctomycetota bacterium]
MERCPTQAVLPLVGLAAEKVIRDRHVFGKSRRLFARSARRIPGGVITGKDHLTLLRK